MYAREKIKKLISFCFVALKMVNHGKSTELQEKKEEDSSSKSFNKKITDAKNTIRKKFKKAYMNRLESECEVNRAINPLTRTKRNKFSLPGASAAQKIETSDPNVLCTRLRVLLAASKTSNEVQRTDEMNAIINRLHELGLLI